VTVDPLLVDLYADDFGGKPNIAALVAAGLPWAGVIFKVSEGTGYPSGADREWILDYWLSGRMAAGARYGKTWFRGGYHYLRIGQDGAAQAKFFLSIVDQAGGWGAGDLWPMIDVEGANNPPDASAQQIVDCVSAFAEAIGSTLGRACCLYGNQYLAERGVTSTMRCGALVIPRYTPTLPAEIYERIGWKIASPAAMPTVFGWQYSGDPEGGELAGYPTKSPLSSTENSDITAMIVAGGGQAALDWTSANLMSLPPAS